VGASHNWLYASAFIIAELAFDMTHNTEVSRSACLNSYDNEQETPKTGSVIKVKRK